MKRILPALLVFSALLANLIPAPIEKDLLLHWKFDEGSGETTKDHSPNGINGAVKAAWVEDGLGKALRFDGTSATIVSSKLPDDKRFGKLSWTFLAWVKPSQFTIEDKQNQRRIFAYGKYPDAYLVIDINGSGQVISYFCYKNEAGKVVSSGSGASAKLKLGEWAQIAFVCDREANQIRIYINSQPQGETELPVGWSGDFSLTSEFTVGNSWHNYMGLMDEVKIWRRTVTKEEVRAEFNALKGAFKITESAEAASVDARESVKEALAAGNAAWAAGKHAAARIEFGKALVVKGAPAGWRSYAHLRIAQSFAAEKNQAGARAEYEKIQKEATYPEAHRTEAKDLITELDRLSKGLPARDPLASRTKIPVYDRYAGQVWVSPSGNDSGDGSEQKPVATLQKAQELARALKAKNPSGPLAVTLKAGAYPISKTLALGAEDSGTEKTPIVWRAEKPGTAVLYGGARIKGFKPVTDKAVLDRLPAESRGKVQVTDLKAQGISQYGELKVRGFGQPASPPTLELYFNGKAQTLARWPNEGFVPIKKLVDGGRIEEQKASIIEYDSDRHARWTKAEDLWLFGYFKFLWADATIKVTLVNPADKTLTMAQAYRYGGTGMETKQGIIYYAFNLLEEIDMPGEWYVDRTAGLLYFYPPSDANQAQVELGMFDGPFITVKQASHIRLEGLTLDLGRFNGILIENGKNNLVAGCTVKRMAGNGISILGGSDSGIFGCDVHTIGRRATEVIGGDRASLTPGRHFVENCRIHNFGRIDRTYTPAIQLEGVGNRVAHNLMYDCPSSVMRIEGNDHLIEYNQVHSAVQESDDQGGMENFRNPTYRGVIFRFNQFSHVGKTGKEAAMHGQAAIRFDDAISGMLVYGNIFYRSANGHFGGVQMNSGRDNLMDNNIFADCKYGVTGGWNSGNNVWKLIREGKKPADFYTDKLYLDRYPAIAWMMEEPGINHVWRNLFWQCGRVVTGNRATLDLMENAIYTNGDPGFVDAAKGDFRLKPDAPVFAITGFRPIPVDEIGLYADALRASWPVESRPVALRDWRETMGKVKIVPHPMAPVQVKKIAAVANIDGKPTTAKWPGDGLKMKETPERQPIKGAPATAWFAHDGKVLYVAVRVPVAEKAKMRAGKIWGQHEGLEICLRDENNLAVGQRSPTFVLQGFTGGESQGAGHPEEEYLKENRALAAASRYACVVGSDAWSCEWAIPLESLGVKYTPKMRLQFNIGVRRTDSDDWIALAGAMGANFRLDNATVLVLE
jgi:hypothetical protein